MGYRVDLLTEPDWQMLTGERAAMEGLLVHLQPEISIELGTYLGGSLRHIAAHSGHVHAFDLTLQVDPRDFPNVTFHVGDCHVLLPQVLDELAGSSGARVQFALVDGDHSPGGVGADVVDLLSSPAFAAGIILLHDTTNEAVRTGIEAIPWKTFRKVADVNLDFVEGTRARNAFSEGWSGLGLVVVDDTRVGEGAEPTRHVFESRIVPRTVRTARRRARRIGGSALRRIGWHPSQR